jgi:YggT family protein
MFFIGNLISAIAVILNYIFITLRWVIIIRAVLSWVNADPYNGFVRLICVITEPILRPFRRLLPPWKLGGVDLSPVFAILTIELIRIFLIPTLDELAIRLR